MFETGITGMRLNLSHGTLKHSAGMIEAFHKASAEAGVRPSLLIDMQGPELRIGNIEKGRILEEGETVELADRSRAFVPKGAIPVPPEIFSHYEDGMILLIDDGKRKLKTTGLVHSAERDTITARVLTGGELLSRKSIAAEGMAITGNTLTEQDLMNLKNAAKYGVSDVMQPFVRGAKDLREVRRAMQESGAGGCRLFAKIENAAGIAAVDEIMPLTDMIVIARGDLGNAVPLWNLPYVQKEISAKCLQAGVPFMVVTQMLASMEKAPVPTRAEVSDIFNAVADGASAVMITGESASGMYPLQAADYLVRTAREGLRWREGRS
jgi:pyruvate kinase